MTISLQYPISDYIHGSFNYCKGRFEVFFNPTHPDPITPGINFANILRSHFSYKCLSSAQNFAVYGFVIFCVRILAQKLLIKCWQN